MFSEQTCPTVGATTHVTTQTKGKLEAYRLIPPTLVNSGVIAANAAIERKVYRHSEHGAQPV